MKVVVVMLAATFLTGCVSNDSPPRREGFRLVLERGPCYGFCPVYWLEILGDGAVSFEGVRYTTHDGQKAEGKLTVDEVEALINEFSEVKFFQSLEQDCERRFSDHSTFTLEVDREKQHGKASRYLGCVSARTDPVVLFAKYVDDLVGANAWTTEKEIRDSLRQRHLDQSEL